MDKSPQHRGIRKVVSTRLPTAFGVLDMIEANEALGFDADCRDFTLAVAVLHELKVRQVRLMSNNPQKVEALIKGEIEVIELVACEAPPSPYALPYLRTKKEKMGHSL